VATPTGQEDHGHSDVTVVCVLSTDVTLVIMACSLDSESSDENEFSVNGGRIQPFMFQPEYSEEELPRDEDKKAVSTTEPAVAEEGDTRKIFIHRRG